jgi:hypothetical protein
MNFFSRFQGVIFNPQPTFKRLSEKPIWVDALILLLLVSALFSYVISPYTQQDNVRLFESNTRLQERMGEERFNDMLEGMRNPSKTRVILQSFLMNPVTLLVGFLISSLVLLLLGRMTSSEGNYVQVFSAYLHANFIDKILGMGVKLIIILSKKSVMQAATSLALFFPKLEVTSPAFIVLNQFDFFQLWLFGILGYGLSHIFNIELKKAMFIAYGFWLIKSLFYIGITLLGMRLMGG